jgi:hypothetical protein
LKISALRSGYAPNDSNHENGLQAWKIPGHDNDQRQNRALEYKAHDNLHAYASHHMN